ncbi:MAG: peptidoglycan DD-metalloendopeptidase family protein [Candidatus Rokubacteria bacterium]|nr:peptidoglycan DD-metalloendopeptidase family protein [Candidatus Rokubacteria bacterium]
MALAVAALAVAGVRADAQPRKDDRLQAEQKRLLDTQRQLREQREKAADARKRETSVLAELEETEKRLGDKQRDVRRLDGRARKTQAELQALRGDVERLEGQRKAQQDALARRLRSMYKLHAQGAALPIILTTEDPVARAITLRQLSRLAALDARMIQEYRVITERLGDRRAREEARQRDLAALKAEAQREQLEVDREAAKRRILLSRVRDERAYHERMVGELSEAARKLEAFVRDLRSRQRRVAKVPPPSSGIEPPAAGFGTLRGRLPWPTEGRIVTTFGAQVHPRFGTRTFRNGVDIEAVEGTDVKAVFGGNVVYTGWFKGYGNLIIVDHGHEYYTLYAHVADILVREGDDVRPGQRIGTVGDTGSLSGARLYFEVRFQGKALDPAEWLRQRG